jgi:LmbE family N-acetylglucosaminyl deacetylase
MNQYAFEYYEGTYPLLLPHVTVVQNVLYIGNKRLRTITDEEGNLCSLCNGLTPLSDILTDAAGQMILSELAPFIIHLPFSLNQSGQHKDARKVLVISPNPQTCFLSVGGTCLKWKDAEILNLICFSNTADCVIPGLFTNANEISAIRFDEGEICARLCNCTNRFLNYPDFSNRKLHWETGSRADLPFDLAATLTFALYNIISDFKPAIILAPAAIGNHPDNSMIHNIVVDFFKLNHFPDVDIFLYQDFPYSVSYNLVDDFLCIRAPFHEKNNFVYFTFEQSKISFLIYKAS